MYFQSYVVVLFLYLLVWVSLYLFSIFWCIYFSSETKTDNEVSFIPNLATEFPLFFCTFSFEWCCSAGLIGHSGFNGICIVALCQLFWRDKFEKSNVKIQFLGITAKYEAKADNSSITIHSIFIRNLLLKVNLSSGWPNGGGWRKNICCWWWSYY